jgi:hypothetical protein
VLNLSGNGDDNIVLKFTQAWLWAAAVTDISISAVIIYGLCSERTGLETTTDDWVARIISTAMGSAALSTTFALAAAVTNAVTWNGSS